VNQPVGEWSLTGASTPPVIQQIDARLDLPMAGIQ